MNADGTPMNADSNRARLDLISQRVIGAAQRVSSNLGVGFLEKVYENALMLELSERMHAALASCLELPAESRPLLVSHGIALGCLVSTILGLPAHAERRLRLRNCSISRVDYQQSLWLASGWVVETAGDVSHLDAPAMDELQR